MTHLSNKTKDSCKWDSIVIGSGLGGLVTASQLASKGAKVLVLEQYKIPGKVQKFLCWNSIKFLVEVVDHLKEKYLLLMLEHQ